MMKKALGIFIISILLFSGCELFEASAFPEYFAGIVAEHDYAERIRGLFGEDFSIGIRYQLLSLSHSDAQHVYFLITPLSGEPVILQLNERGGFVRTIELSETFSRKNSFSLPFIVANNHDAFVADDILAGTVSFNPVTTAQEELVQEKVDHDLEGGYAVALRVEGGLARASGTYIFGHPMDGSAIDGYFTLRIIAFVADSTGSWARHVNVEGADVQEINIVPIPATGTHPTTSPSARGGYALSGLIQINGGVILLFRDLTENELILWSLDNSQIRDYQLGIERSSIQELNAGSSRATISLENADLISYTSQEIIVHRVTGVLERFDLNGTFQDAVRTERRVGILFAFSSDGTYMYRLDPEILKLQVMETWWQ